MIQLRADTLLRPIGPEHATSTFHIISSPAIAENLGLRSEPSLEKTIAWIEQSVAEKDRKSFAIIVGNDHVGNVVLDRIDDFLSTARFSIYLDNSRIVGSGAGTTATYLACFEGFRNMGLNKIWLTVHTDNNRAIKAYQRAGFKIEGLLRQEFILHGRLVDVHYMGLLSDEFSRIATDGGHV